MADAVGAAARDFGAMETNVRSGQVLAQDAVLEVIEQIVIAIDNLRIGAGTVHVRVTELESRAIYEVVRIMGYITMGYHAHPHWRDADAAHRQRHECGRQQSKPVRVNLLRKSR